MTKRTRPSHQEDEPQLIIGWREYVALPEWGIDYLKVKADTGARTSAIDVARIEELPGHRVRFDAIVQRVKGEADKIVTIEAPIVRQTHVKSSFGASHERYFVETTMKLGPIEKTIELSLVSRKNMLCRMLLGRKALEGDMVVDSQHRYLHGRKPRRKRTKKR